MLVRPTSTSPAEALAHRDAMDELAGIYSLRLQRALESVYAVARRPARPTVAEAAFADAVRGVRDIDDWYLRTVDQLYGELEAAASPEGSEPIARHRHEVAELLRDAAVVAIAGGHVGILLRCLRLFAVVPAARAARRGLVGRGDGDDRAGRALQRPRAARRAGRRGLGPRDRDGCATWSRCRTRGAGSASTTRSTRGCSSAGSSRPTCLLLDDGTQVEIGADGSVPEDARVLTETGAATS